MVATTPNDAPAYGAQAVTDMARYIDAPQQPRDGPGVNGDFFNTTSYEPMGIVYKNSVGVKTAFTNNADKPQQGLSFLAMLKDGAALILVDRDNDYPTVKTQIKEALRRWCVPGKGPQKGNAKCSNCWSP